MTNYHIGPHGTMPDHTAPAPQLTVACFDTTDDYTMVFSHHLHNHKKVENRQLQFAKQNVLDTAISQFIYLKSTVVQI